MKYFVTAIGTDSGKTLVSAILVEALKADYWKPVQSGAPTDTETIKLLTNEQYRCFPERYLLRKPASPHDAAREEGIEISLDDFTIPETDNNLIIEGAGGLLVPLNDKDTIFDLVKKLNVEVILVSNLYLGSINHTLLSIELLKSHKVPVKGIVFNGIENKESERIIEKYSPWKCLFKIRQQETVTPEVVERLAKEIRI